ncbi:MAG: hypothetical protein IKD69_00405 [Solobacterium sp.]|nr:hypothetical protein [Solobacterium sp.]
MAIEAAVIRKQRREFTLLKINGVPSRALSPIPFLQRFPDYTAMLLLSMILRLRTVLQYTFILPVTEAVLLILLSWYLSAMRIEDILRS